LEAFKLSMDLFGASVKSQGKALDPRMEAMGFLCFSMPWKILAFSQKIKSKGQKREKEKKKKKKK